MLTLPRSFYCSKLVSKTQDTHKIIVILDIWTTCLFKMQVLIEAGIVPVGTLRQDKEGMLGNYLV